MNLLVPLVWSAFFWGFAIAPASYGSDAVNTEQQLQPALVAFVHATYCPVCRKVRPLLGEIQQTYGDKIMVVNLEVTEDGPTTEAKGKAKELGLSSFLSSYSYSYPTTGIFTSQKKRVKIFEGVIKKEALTAAIDKALAQ